MPEARVVVVGAGIGGIASALLLAARGVQVTLVEAADAPGGKLRPLQVDGARIDAGPTVFTMRWVFDELLDAVGSSAEQALPPLAPLSLLARHAWAHDGSRLDLWADRTRAADAVAAFAGVAEARRYLAFTEEAARVYRTLESPHIRAQRPGVLEMIHALGPRGLATLSALGPLTTLASVLGRRFRDARLRQLFARYATYCGCSPWGAPSTLMLVAHVEQAGVWSVQGGMAALADALVRLACARGVVLRLGARCERIEVQAGSARAVHIAGGERLPADAVVFNGDASALGALLADAASAAPAPVPPRRRSLSALTWAVHAAADGFPLSRHNVFFGADYASEFDDVFRLRRLPRQGTVYVCAQDRLDDAPATSTRQRLLLLVNAPADGDVAPDNTMETEACQTRSLQLLRQCGLTLDLSPSPAVVRRTPADFARLYPATGGALYGAAGHGWMAVFRRPAGRTALPGLFLAGGSAHPGPGVPMAAMSGRLAADSVMAHLASTRRSHPVPTSGGTSTRSATMDAMR